MTHGRNINGLAEQAYPTSALTSDEYQPEDANRCPALQSVSAPSSSLRHKGELFFLSESRSISSRHWILPSSCRSIFAIRRMRTGMVPKTLLRPSEAVRTHPYEADEVRNRRCAASHDEYNFCEKNSDPADHHCASRKTLKSCVFPQWPVHKSLCFCGLSTTYIA